jgi:transcriptional regulator with XRE-family HTH domain
LEQKEENLVKKTCRELGITQKELAEKIGLSDRTLSKYATGNIPKNIVNHIKLISENSKQKELLYKFKNNIRDIENYINN